MSIRSGRFSVSRILLTVILGIVAVEAAPQCAIAIETSYPNGIGAAKLMMTLDQAKAAIPGLPVVEASAANSNPAPDFAYAEAKLADQQFGPLEPCNVTLTFFEKRLINFTAVCPDKSATEKYLKMTYGPPGTEKPEGWEWPGARRSMTYQPTSGVITVADSLGTGAFQTRLMMFISAQQLKQAAAPPAATPPAATPPAAPK